MAISQEEYDLIEEILEELEVENYTINDDGVVDVDGGVFFGEAGLKEIPVQFGKVTGDFYCSDNYLSTLKGAPEKVSGSFYCYNNELTSLEGAPKYVGGRFFNCSANKLTSLKNSPKEVGGNFDCSKNKLIDLKGAPRKVGGNFSCFGNDFEDDPKIELDDLGVKVKGEIY
jgi:hypothetical protein